MIEPRDDHPHEKGAESAWSESTYFNFVDTATGLAGFSRIGFRPNEGTADAMLFLFLPEGGAVAVLEREQRLDIPENARVGGIAHERREELARWVVEAHGKGLAVARADAVDIAGAQSRAGVVLEVRADLAFDPFMPPFGTSGRNKRSADAAAAAAATAAGHFEQGCRVHGSIRAGDLLVAVEGIGLRDRSWGPRDWSAPWGWRWFSIPFGADLAIGVHSVFFPGREVQAGWAWRDGRTIKMKGFELDTTYEGTFHRSLTITATDVEGETYKIEGNVLSVIPLKFGGTRVHEGLTRFRMNGRQATGIAEYLDNT